MAPPKRVLETGASQREATRASESSSRRAATPSSVHLSRAMRTHTPHMPQIGHKYTPLGHAERYRIVNHSSTGNATAYARPSANPATSVASSVYLRVALA